MYIGVIPRSPTWSRAVVLAVAFSLAQIGSETQAATRAAQPIEDPNGGAMLGFYQSLERALYGEGVARVVHYGDSHVAADILTGALRREMQGFFGDAGPGFVLPGHPWPGYSRAGVTSQTSAGWRVEGLTQASIASDERLGLAGVSVSTFASGEWISVTCSASYFDVYLLKQPGGGSIDVLIDGIEKKHNVLLASAKAETACLELAAVGDVTHTIEIRTVSPGHTRVFGIAIERNGSGVVYDALGINGARAGRPLQWDWKVLASSLARRNPDLIIVAYGSNEVSDRDLDLEEYQASIATLLKGFRKATPHASLLVIGPPDRAVRTGGRWTTIGRMRALVEAQRRAALESGAAFYDLFNAMGSAGSIDRWAAQPQPLAQRDRVHLTSAGYKVVADWLYTELVNGFLRNAEERKP